MDTDKHKQMIQDACDKQAVPIKSWGQDEDYAEPRPQAILGRASAITEDEDRGLYEGCEGELTASVVGAPEHGNERVYFGFMEDGSDCPIEVEPNLEVELI